MESKKQREDKFTFEYISTVDTAGQYGKYIYRNIYTNKLVASYNSPFIEKDGVMPSTTSAQQTQRIVKQQFFTSSEVGLGLDALYLPF